MADLAIEGEKQTSNWLQQHFTHVKNGQGLYATSNKFRIGDNNNRHGNLRSTCTESAGNLSTKLTYFRFPTSANGARTDAVRIQDVKELYGSQQPHELPKGYMMQSEAWMTNQSSRINNKDNEGLKVGNITSDNHSQHQDKTMFTGTVTSHVPLYRSVSASPLRPKNGNQRVLGITRGDKLSKSADFHLAGIREWRAMTPEYLHIYNSNTADTFMKLDNNPVNRSSFHYYGQTRIHLEDPAGLSYESRYKDQQDIQHKQKEQLLTSKTSAQPNKKLLHRRSEKMVIMKNARKMSQGLPSNAKCSIGQPYDYTAWTSPISSPTQESLIHTVNNNNNTLTNVTSTAKNEVSKEASLTESNSVPVMENKNFQSLSSGILGSYALLNPAKQTVFKPESSQPVISNNIKDLNERLSLSELFLLNVGKCKDMKKQNSKRTVRFKVRDLIHEYEPWEPIKS